MTMTSETHHGETDGDDESLPKPPSTTGSEPGIAAKPETLITLPRGIISGGVWEVDVEVRELTGYDEEALDKYRTAVDFFEGVLALGTVSIGPVELGPLSKDERKGVLGKLLPAERTAIYLAIVAASFGNERDMKFTCGTCKAEVEVTLDLKKDFPLPEMTDTGRTVFTHTVKHGATAGDVLTYRLITGTDEREILAKKNPSAGEQNTQLLSSILQKVNGGPFLDPEAYVRGMSMQARRELLDDLVSKQPNIDLELVMECPSCGTKNTFEVTWEVLFRP